MQTTSHTPDWPLLRRYVEQQSQEVFAALVARHLNLVYATCRREVGDAALAEDVTQAVFLLLARKAPALRSGTHLAGWLFQTARFASRNALTREGCRRHYEQKAAQTMASDQATQDSVLWDGLEPLLNDALESQVKMNTHPDTDHEVWPPAPPATTNTGEGRRLPPSWLATAPPEVIVFAVFSAVVSLAQYWLVFAGPGQWERAVIPYTGGASVSYLNPLIFACCLLFTPKITPAQAPKFRLRMTACMAVMLLIMSISGAYKFMLSEKMNVNQFHNPYMTVSDWQPVWTVAFPLVWVLVLTVGAARRARKTVREVPDAQA